MADQQAYWNAAADKKSFSHPLPLEWLRALHPDCRILDYGCGYGRIASALVRLGFSNVVGVDFSSAMIKRGGRENPGLDLRVISGPRLPFDAGTFDALFLFAVLTCIPDKEDQDDLMNEIRRLLRPGGFLFLSDMPLQTAERDLVRYARDQHRFGEYGVFETSDGAIVRHHSEARLATLLTGFHECHRRVVDVLTMNGSPSRAVQIVAMKAAPPALPA